MSDTGLTRPRKDSLPPPIFKMEVTMSSNRNKVISPLKKKNRRKERKRRRRLNYLVRQQEETDARSLEYQARELGCLVAKQS